MNPHNARKSIPQARRSPHHIFFTCAHSSANVQKSLGELKFFPYHFCTYLEPGWLTEEACKILSSMAFVLAIHAQKTRIIIGKIFVNCVTTSTRLTLWSTRCCRCPPIVAESSVSMPPLAHQGSEFNFCGKRELQIVILVTALMLLERPCSYPQLETFQHLSLRCDSLPRIILGIGLGKC